MVNRTLDKYALMINKIMINVKLAERAHSYIKSLGHKMSVDTNLFLSSVQRNRPM